MMVRSGIGPYNRSVSSPYCSCRNTTKAHKTAQIITNRKLLLFLEPVLLDPRQGSQARVNAVSLATTLFVVQIRSASGTKTPAIAAANRLHWHCQQNLLAKDIREEQAIALIKPDVRVVIFKPLFFRLGVFGHWAVEEVECAMHIFRYGFQAASTRKLQLGLQLAGNADLGAFKQLGRCGYVQRFNLLDFAYAIVDGARSIALPQAQLANSQLFHVQE